MLTNKVAHRKKWHGPVASYGSFENWCENWNTTRQPEMNCNIETVLP